MHHCEERQTAGCEGGLRRSGAPSATHLTKLEKKSVLVGVVMVGVLEVVVVPGFRDNCHLRSL